MLRAKTCCESYLLNLSNFKAEKWTAAKELDYNDLICVGRITSAHNSCTNILLCIGIDVQPIYTTLFVHTKLQQLNKNFLSGS